MEGLEVHLHSKVWLAVIALHMCTKEQRNEVELPGHTRQVKIATSMDFFVSTPWSFEFTQMAQHYQCGGNDADKMGSTASVVAGYQR